LLLFPSKLPINASHNNLNVVIFTFSIWVLHSLSVLLALMTIMYLFESEQSINNSRCGRLTFLDIPRLVGTFPSTRCRPWSSEKGYVRPFSTSARMVHPKLCCLVGLLQVSTLSPLLSDLEHCWDLIPEDMRLYVEYWYHSDLLSLSL
jgi:hypothetical protein